MTRAFMIPCLILGSVAASAAAQGGEGSGSTKVDRRAQDMREQIDSGEQVKSHVRISVRLKNGNKLLGIVKDGRFVERVDGLRFVEAQAKDTGAGIRLWYSGGSRNYVFVPFKDFAEYEVLQRLTHKQLADVETEMQMAERRAAERKAAQTASEAKAQAEAKIEAPADSGIETPPAPDGDPTEGVPPTPAETPAKTPANTPAKTPAKSKADAAAEAKQEQDKLWFRLAQEYPPSAGWNKAKADEIRRRPSVIGARPSAAEQFFADNFAQWEKACSHFGVAAPAKAAEVEPTDPAEARKARRAKK